MYIQEKRVYVGFGTPPSLHKLPHHKSCSGQRVVSRPAALAALSACQTCRPTGPTPGFQNRLIWSARWGERLCSQFQLPKSLASSSSLLPVAIFWCLQHPHSELMPTSRVSTQRRHFSPALPRQHAQATALSLRPLAQMGDRCHMAGSG